jgi:hypothetical protein
MGEFPKVSPGDDFSPLLLNSRWVNGLSGMLSGSAIQPNEQDNGLVVVREVLITATIPPATWDKATKKLTPVRVTAPEWFIHKDGDWSYTYNTDIKVSFYSFFKKEVGVASGKGRVGLVIGNRVFNIDCEELDIS